MENSFTRPEGMKIMVLVQTTLPSTSIVAAAQRGSTTFQHFFPLCKTARNTVFQIPNG
jgi:hypothetical protein